LQSQVAFKDAEKSRLAEAAEGQIRGLASKVQQLSAQVCILSGDKAAAMNDLKNRDNAVSSAMSELEKQKEQCAAFKLKVHKCCASAIALPSMLMNFAYSYLGLESSNQRQLQRRAAP
jgi:hypothetical protein